MKPMNFPARKLRRQLVANKLNPEEHQKELSQARQVKTKKDRRG